MYQKYEQINYQSDVPIKVFTQTVESFPYHWHEDIEILFVLEGSLEIRVNRDSYSLEKGNIFLVNENELHFIDSKTDFGSTQVLAFQMDIGYFKKYDLNLKGKKFYLNSNQANESTEFALDEIKYILANLMDLIMNKKNLYQLKTEKLLIDLIVILMEHFEIATNKGDQSIENDSRMLEILKYMNSHCLDSQLSLQEIAKEFSLNPQYLSRYFKANAGETLKKKLDSMRLNKSLMTLRTTNETIIEVALKSGFPDSKAYYRVFKEVLGITPLQYREQYKFYIEKSVPKDYLSINSKESLATLFTYLLPKGKAEKTMVAGRTVNVHFNQVAEPIHYSFTKLLTFGFAAHALRKDFTEQLMQIQNEINFEFIRFHGIFADQLLVYNEKPDGSYYFNFNHVDGIIDNLLEADIKPFIEIGFMPKDLAATPDKIFWWDAVISPPKDMERWLEMLEAFFKHFINRYGLMEIRSWYFEFWNEPEVKSFWSGTKEEFFDLYTESYKCIKTIDREIKIGGFGIMNIADTSWIAAMEAYLAEKAIGIDFFSFHVYNLDRNPEMNKKIMPEIEKVGIAENPIGIFSKNGSIMLGDENHISKSIDHALKKSRIFSFVSDEIWITEWNGSINSRDLLHDTCYMAAFIVKTALENAPKVTGMGYWTFTDIFEEFQLEQPMFHGGFGLMTYNGIKKAGYHAYYFLNQLGDELILQEEDLTVTKRGNDYQILLYNYSHPSKLYRTFDSSQLSATSRYTVFENERIKSYQLKLHGLEGEFTVKKQMVNRDQGSAFDAWVKMGAPDEVDESAINYLKSRAEPSMDIQSLTIDNEFLLQTELQPHEIQLIELKKKY